MEEGSKAEVSGFEKLFHGVDLFGPPSPISQTIFDVRASHAHLTDWQCNTKQEYKVETTKSQRLLSMMR